MRNLLKFVSKKIADLKKQKEEYEKQLDKEILIPPLKEIKSREKIEQPRIMELTVSSQTIIKILFIVTVFFAGIRIINQLQTLLIMVSISGLLALGLTPILNQIEKRGIPRPVAIFILYIIFLGAISVLFIQIVPIIAEQLLSIAHDLKNFVLSDNISTPFLKHIDLNLNFEGIKDLLAQNLTDISRNLQNVAGSTLGIISNVFQGLFNFLFTLTLLFFMLLEREVIGAAILQFFPRKNQKYVLHKTLSVQKKMSEWFRGQFILMISVGLFVYIGMLILGWTVGMEYAATIGILAGFAELLPYIGPLLTYILVGLISINISWLTFFLGMGFVFVVQMLEGNILVPLVMKKAVGLPSIITLLSLAAGGILGYSSGGIAMSIVGMVFSIPIAASIAIFIEEDAPHH